MHSPNTTASAVLLSFPDLGDPLSRPSSPAG